MRCTSDRPKRVNADWLLGAGMPDAGAAAALPRRGAGVVASRRYWSMSASVLRSRKTDGGGRMDDLLSMGASANLDRRGVVARGWSAAAMAGGENAYR